MYYSYERIEFVSPVNRCQKDGFAINLYIIINSRQSCTEMDSEKVHPTVPVEILTIDLTLDT